jgi:hypothetical protein
MDDTAAADPHGRWEPASVAEVGSWFRSITAPWWIAGGYAIEHAVGAPFRAHGDIDVLLLRRDQLAAQEALPDWEWWAAEPPGSLRRWRRGEVLPEAVHDIWCRPGPDAPWWVQFMLDEAEGDQWISRRDPRIRRPIASLNGGTADGVTYLAPEIQLFYKAKGLRPKDEQDFDKTLPILTGPQRAWLRDAIVLTHGDHPCLHRLDSAGGDLHAAQSQ